MEDRLLRDDSIVIGDRVAFWTNTGRRRIGHVVDTVNWGVLKIECEDKWCVFRLSSEVLFLNNPEYSIFSKS